MESIMDIKQYLEQSERTAPKFENGLDVNDSILEALRFTISEMIKVGNPLDDLKKHIYYKKPFSWIDPVNKIAKETVNLPQYEADIIHAIVGIATESVELLEALYDRLSGKEIDVVNLVEEISDVMWYQALLLRTLNTDFEQTGAINIDKLYRRFPHKFDNDKAIFRDVGDERKFLEERINRNGEKPESKIII
jgi:NTP pyrophosphatase (non-canonical NTP hydrolase)